MRVTHTRASWAAAAGTGLLAAVHAVRSIDTSGSASYVAMLDAVAAALACLISLKLCRDNCFESRLAAVILAVVSGVGAVLGATLGLPGQPSGTVTGGAVVLVLLGVGVPLLVLHDQRLRRRQAVRPPYAS